MKLHCSMLQWVSSRTRALQKTAAITGSVLAVFFCLVFVFGVPQDANTQSVADSNSTVNQGLDIIEEPLGLPTTDIRTIIARIIRAALGLLGIVLVVIILYGGYLWMTAGGNEEQIGEAKRILKNAVIGLIIILMAYGIVLFVMRLLGIEGSGGSGGNVTVPSDVSFQGTGALGNIIKDHYPTRNQKDVPRNTKIAITFRRPIKPDSIINNTNRTKDGSNTVFGDCINLNNIDWKTDCDALKTGGDFITIARLDTGATTLASVLAAYDDKGKVYTLLIRPYDYLGSSETNVQYSVRIGKGILLDDPANNNPSVFDKRAIGNDYYEWKFTVGTFLDLTPPHVLSTYPAKNKAEAKNSIIQIDFNEPINPIGIQGAFVDNGQGHYSVAGVGGFDSIFLRTLGSTLPAGSFSLTNGYRTLEFTPTTPCGQNACGGTIYCMPVCDRAGADCESDTYDLILRAAKTRGKTFEADPFTGFMDMADNALDSDPLGGSPQVATTTLPIFNNWKVPENYTWSFTLKNEIDNTAPYLIKVTPGIDAERVAPEQDWGMEFSKRMRASSMEEGISIEQEPEPAIPLCIAPRSWFNADGTTDTRMDHCPFTNTSRNYYYPVITSAVEDVNFNCLYPGKGPIGLNGSTGASYICNAENPNNCCVVTSSVGVPGEGPLCCNGSGDPSIASPESCVDVLKQRSQ